MLYSNFLRVLVYTRIHSYLISKSFASRATSRVYIPNLQTAFVRILEGRLIAKGSAIRMPRKNEILVEWLDSRDKGACHRINVKYISNDKSVVREKEEIEVKMNGRRYR